MSGDCWCKMLNALVGIHKMRSQKIAKIQEQLTDKCAAILLAYRKYCAASAPASQVRGRTCCLFMTSLTLHLAHHSRSLPSASLIHASSHEVAASQRYTQLSDFSIAPMLKYS